MRDVDLAVLAAVFLFRGELTTRSALAAVVILGAGSSHGSHGSHNSHEGSTTLGGLLEAVTPPKLFPTLPEPVPLFLRLPVTLPGG